jgi:hypothetical protein
VRRHPWHVGGVLTDVSGRWARSEPRRSWINTPEACPAKKKKKSKQVRPESPDLASPEMVFEHVRLAASLEGGLELGLSGQLLLGAGIMTCCLFE